MNFYKLSKLIEDYKDVNYSDESQKIYDLNMTAKLPLAKSPEEHSDMMSNLTRGFHLNTIVGRMMQNWVAALRFAPKEYRLPDSKIANDKFKAAYDLFKDEIAKSIHALPEKTAIDIVQNKQIDVLSSTKDFFKEYSPGQEEFLTHLRYALSLYFKVFGEPDGYNSQVQNFINFLQIAKEEFFTIGEKLPTFSEKPLEISQSKIIKNINKFINELEKRQRTQES